MAGFSALTQWDLKRVLAYSTISQIGYMFLALGVGAWPAAIFHFMTHAFFKALLFLGAGIVIQSLGEEHNIFRMGGLRKQLPVAFWTFLIAGLSLAGLPGDVHSLPNTRSLVDCWRVC
jgi:NADH-quinone oxidoreductase subunit L